MKFNLSRSISKFQMVRVHLSAITGHFSALCGCWNPVAALLLFFLFWITILVPQKPEYRSGPAKFIEVQIVCSLILLDFFFECASIGKRYPTAGLTGVVASWECGLFCFEAMHETKKSLGYHIGSTKASVFSVADLWHRVVNRLLGDRLTIYDFAPLSSIVDVNAELRLCLSVTYYLELFSMATCARPIRT